MFKFDKATGKKLVNVRLLVLADTKSPIPGFEHIPRWLKLELVRQHPNDVLAYLDCPEDIDARQRLCLLIEQRLVDEIELMADTEDQAEPKDFALPTPIGFPVKKHNDFGN